MDFQEVVRRRRMVRNFDGDRPVDPAVLERILQNALHAPSAGFSQGWGFLLLESGPDVARFWSVTTPPGGGTDPWSEGMQKAPVLIVACSNKEVYLDRYAETDKGWDDRSEAHWPAPYWDIDTGMAVLLMLQTVTDAGLGACFFGVPADQVAPFRTEFGVPEAYNPIGVVAVGHREEDRRSPSLRRGRKPVEDVVHRSHW